EFASKPVFIVGHSEGGSLAPIVAQRAGVAGVAVVNTVQFAVDELVVAQLGAMNLPPDKLDEVKRFFAQIKDGSFPRGGLLLGAGANYWRQWIKYSADSPATLARLRVPLLLVQCMSDETLPGETLARNVVALRSVVAARKDAQLRELEGHDHLGLLPGSREPSAEFVRVLSDWVRG